MSVTLMSNGTYKVQDFIYHSLVCACEDCLWIDGRLHQVENWLRDKDTRLTQDGTD